MTIKRDGRESADGAKLEGYVRQWPSGDPTCRGCGPVFLSDGSMDPRRVEVCAACASLVGALV